jgi:hypothetical protein
MHECIQQETLGKFKEFIDSIKGFKIVLFSMAGTIILQVITFAFLWGCLTTTVSSNTEHLWKNITPRVEANTANIDKILGKFELIKVIQGIQGEKGEKGDK